MRKNKQLELTEPTTDILIVIGDIHGLTKWRKVVEIHSDAKCFVFLGDYCDPYSAKITDEKVVDNLIDIIKFKKKYPGRVVLLLGNHDMHYLEPSLPKGSRYNLALSMMLNDLFKGNESHFQSVYACNRLLFTHAGITRSWFDEFGGTLDLPVAPQILERKKDDAALLQCGFIRGGDFDYGGIYWADIHEFSNDELLPGYIQIVGHNQVSTIQVLGESVLSTGNIVFCDSLSQDNYLVVEHPETDEPTFYESNLRRFD